jgi:hypothetical protein
MVLNYLSTGTTLPFIMACKEEGEGVGKKEKSITKERREKGSKETEGRTKYINKVEREC